jgi:hypothetical protein
MSAIKLMTILAALLATAMPPAFAVQDAPAQKTAFLGFRFIPNAEPITPEEQARLGQIEASYIAKLERDKIYTFVKVPDGMREKIAGGQAIGECAGCEIDYGKELGVPVVMWGSVQKVSNLILNLNIYMADVEQRKMIFVKSVDMRGNTDETWEQAVNYMVKRYVLKSPQNQKDK